MSERPSSDPSEPEPKQARANVHASVQRALRRGRLTRADLQVLRQIKAGYRPQSEHRAWNRLAQLGLAYVEESMSGEGAVELRLWKLTPAGESYVDLESGPRGIERTRGSFRSK